MEDKSPIGQRPVDSKYPITSPFGKERIDLAKKLDLKSIAHKGVDFGTPVGVPIVAYRAGIVRICHDNGDGLGLRMGIEHDKWIDLYCHLSEVFVNVGDRVEQGHTIALTGNSGKSSGPHLHFETRIWENKKYTAVQPWFYTS